MAYKIKKKNSLGYSLNLVTLDSGCSFCFWKKIEAGKIDEVKITMNDEEGININNNQYGIAFKTNTDIKDIYPLMEAFFSISLCDINSIKFSFLVNNSNDESKALKVIDHFGLKGEIGRTKLYQEKIDNDKQQKNNNYHKVNMNSKIKKVYDEYVKYNPQIKEKYEKGEITEEELFAKLRDYLIAKRDENLNKEQKVEKDIENKTVNNVKKNDYVYKPELKIKAKVDKVDNKSNLDFLPSIMFIISFCLLIGSGVILFMMR